MINKVELGNINSKNTNPNKYYVGQKRQNTSFTGLSDLALKGIQLCESKPMVNVTVLDLSTAILPRTFFETFIGSKQKTKTETKQKNAN